MSQLSLYLDDETMSALRDMANAGGTSLSKCAAEIIRNAAVSEWPPGYERLLGAIDDPTFQAPIRIVSKKIWMRGMFDDLSGYQHLRGASAWNRSRFHRNASRRVAR